MSGDRRFLSVFGSHSRARGSGLDKTTPRARWPGPQRRLLALLLTILLVISAVAPAAATAAAATTGAATAPPSGMVGLADSQVSDNVPSQLEDQIPVDPAAWDVHSSAHADDLEATIDVVDVDLFAGEWQLALQFSDDVNHEGREVAVRAETLESVLGYRPQWAVGRHESGDRWQRPIRYEDGYAIFEIPHFSTNTVQFSGTASIQATPATDGSQYQYDVADLDAVDNFTIDVTGHNAREWDNESATGVAGGGGTMAVAIGGNLDPIGPGGAGTDPRLKVTFDPPAEDQLNDGYATPDDGSVLLFKDDGNNIDRPGEIYMQTDLDTVEKIAIPYSEQKDSCVLDPDIYIVDGERPDGTYGEGVLASDNGNEDSCGTGGWYNVSFSSVDVSGNFTVEITNMQGDGTGNQRVKGNYTTQTGTWRSYDGSTDSKAVKMYATGKSDGTVTVEDNLGHTATLTGRVGDTKTARFNATLGTDSLTATGMSGGSVDLVLELQERTETVDPSVEVNGQWTNHTGTLADGSIASLSTDPTWIQEGTNRVNVSVGDGSLSADAPTPSVGLDYSHEAVSNQSTDYTAEKWSERYNISKTYASERTEAAATIPFVQTVYAVRGVEVRFNGSGGWSAVADANYQLDGTTLTVDLDAEYGGSLPAKTKAEVKAAGSKVAVQNGSIEVTEPSPVGSELNTEIAINSAGNDFAIDVSGTPDSDRLHYLSNATWSADEEAVITADGSQVIAMPGASGGDVARIQLVPIEVIPESNEVRVHVTDADGSPSFRVRPGSTLGDAVTYKYYDTISGETYILESISAGVKRDDATASSPVLLSDDDSEETLTIKQEENDGGGDGGGGGGGGIWPDGAPSVQTVQPLLNPALVALLAILLLGAGVAYSERESPGQPVYRRPGVLFATVFALVLAVLLISPTTITGPFRTMLQATLPLVGIGAVLIIGGSVYLWWQQRQTEAETPETVLQIDASDGDGGGGR